MLTKESASIAIVDATAGVRTGRASKISSKHRLGQ